MTRSCSNCAIKDCQWARCSDPCIRITLRDRHNGECIDWEPRNLFYEMMCKPSYKNYYKGKHEV